jgi:hypothetical protein
MKYLLVIVTMLSLFFVCSCDRRSGKTLPSEIEMILAPQEDFYLLLEYEYMGAHSSEDPRLRFVSKQPLVAMYLDDVHIEIRNFRYNDVYGNTSYDYSFNLFDSEFIAGSGDTIRYHIVLEEKSIEGSLVMPNMPIHIEQTFDPMDDLNLEWSLTANPRKQELDVQVQSDSYSVSYYKDLPTDVREHTITRSTWQNVANIENVSINLRTINYEFRHGGLICFVCKSSYWPWDSLGMPNESDILKRIITKNIQLP